MTTLINKVEKELKVPKSQIVELGVKHFLELELQNVSLEIKKISSKYETNFFDELYEKIEFGEISESECLEDLQKLEYLELEKEKIMELLKEAA